VLLDVVVGATLGLLGAVTLQRLLSELHGPALLIAAALGVGTGACATFHASCPLRQLAA